MADRNPSAARIPASRIRLPAAERRAVIVRAATEVFADVGYRAGKVADIAARVGVTEPVIFQNFGSKAGLFAAVIERAAADVRASLDEHAADHGSASDLLAHALSPAQHPGSRRGDDTRGDRHGQAMHPGAAYAVLFADAVALTAEAELTEQLRDAIRAVAGHLADLIRHVQAHGGMRDDIQPEAAAWFLLSVLSAGRMRAAAMPDRLEPAVFDLVLAAMAP
jgi:AcrR family transcriptional regulator